MTMMIPMTRKSLTRHLGPERPDVGRVETPRSRRTSATGSSDTIQRAIRPCAVSVVISRRSSMPVADVLDDLVEHLGRVAARVALQRRDERDLVEVAVLHPLDRPAEGVVERDAELLVRDHAPELASATARARRRRQRTSPRRGCVRPGGLRPARRGCRAAARAKAARFRRNLFLTYVRVRSGGDGAEDDREGGAGDQDEDQADHEAKRSRPESNPTWRASRCRRVRRPP